MSSMTLNPLFMTTLIRNKSPGGKLGSSIYRPAGRAQTAVDMRTGPQTGSRPRRSPASRQRVARRRQHRAPLPDGAGLAETAARAGGPRARPCTNESTPSGSSPTARANRSGPSRLCGHVTRPADPRDPTSREAAQDAGRPWRVCQPAAHDSTRARSPPRRSTKSFRAASAKRGSSPASLARGIRPCEECGTRMRYRPANWGRMPANR